MNAWWNGLQARERRLLLALAALTAALLWWLLLLRPLAAERDRAELAIVGLRQQLGQARAQVDAILLARQSQAPRPVRSLFALIDSSARSASLMNAQTQVEPLAENRVRVRMDGVDFDHLCAWIETLDREEGVDLHEWSVDRALAPGVVDTSMILQISR
ncbi:MAG: type II secretion system protein M [Xanthomonadales bacterium]|nr:hypothetical protein [Xanthomonadales bacterium]MCC6592439.1 type II secretion system protein M [Xanthomonadales bacterium]MCE7931586.1 hypothetical protein [Xanthomonadales bacterium PRO6]